jgi:hypothetical protein
MSVYNGSWLVQLIQGDQMGVDNRYSIQSYDGQKKTLDDLFNRFVGGDLDASTVQGCVALIREARQVLQAQRQANVGNPAVASTIGKELTPNGPFPRLIKK